VKVVIDVGRFGTRRLHEFEQAPSEFVALSLLCAQERDERQLRG
jgi:hypothetical protein